MAKEYKFKKTAEKFLIALVEVLVAGLIALVANSPLWMGLVPIFEAIRNFVKHYNK